MNESHYVTLNSDLGKFRKQLMNQEISIDEEYRKVLQQRFSHGTKLGKAIYVKYVKDDSIVSLDYPDVPCYNNRDKKIFLNATIDLNNPRGAGITWFHEHGHYIDDALVYISEDDVYRNYMDVDLLLYREKYRRKYNMKSLEEVDIAISDELEDIYKHLAISDLMEGFTNGRIVNVVGHGNDYWLDDITNITSEAFAHMFECKFDDNGCKEMKKYFPLSFKYFEKKLNKLKGRLK
ncbi:MAG: hypothetical protein LUG60_08925 [Erysipelotrichaceae bacterium]|nr:hypothetical protein [Erysipelotrichaceae bacterium]